MARGVGDGQCLVMTGRTPTWWGVMVEHPGWSVGLEEGCPSGTGSAEGQEDRWPSGNVHKGSALDFDTTANETVNSGTELECQNRKLPVTSHKTGSSWHPALTVRTAAAAHGGAKRVE